MNRSIACCAALFAGLALAGAANAQGVAESAGATVTPSVPITEGVPPEAYAWGGAWVTNHYVGGYAGVMEALNQDHSLVENGAVLRADVNGGQYSYNNAPAFIDQHVGMIDADVMVGYRKYTESGAFSGYAGIVYINHDNSDPSTSLRGSETGIVLVGEYSTVLDKRVQVDLQGRYASPFTTWGGSARALWKINDYAWLGPQVSYVHDESPYGEVSVGPLLKINTDFGEVGVTGGWRHPTTSGSADGYYASVYFAVPIHR